MRWFGFDVAVSTPHTLAGRNADRSHAHQVRPGVASSVRCRPRCVHTPTLIGTYFYSPKGTTPHLRPRTPRTRAYRFSHACTIRAAWAVRYILPPIRMFQKFYVLYRKTKCSRSCLLWRCVTPRDTQPKKSIDAKKYTAATQQIIHHDSRQSLPPTTYICTTHAETLHCAST